MVAGLKRLEKENLRKAHLELTNRLSNLKLGAINSGLSASASPFTPLAASSATAMAPPQAPQPLMHTTTDTTCPFYQVGNDDLTRELGAVGGAPRRRHGRRQRQRRHQHDSEVSDSSSDASTASSNQSRGKKKKTGVNNKVNIPEFGGKKANPQDVADAF